MALRSSSLLATSLFALAACTSQQSTPPVESNQLAVRGTAKVLKIDSTLGQMVLVYGVVEAGLKGWSTFAALGPIALGAALLGLFAFIEARVASAPAAFPSS